MNACKENFQNYFIVEMNRNTVSLGQVHCPTKESCCVCLWFLFKQCLSFFFSFLPQTECSIMSKKEKAESIDEKIDFVLNASRYNHDTYLLLARD